MGQAKVRRGEREGREGDERKPGEMYRGMEEVRGRLSSLSGDLGRDLLVRRVVAAEVLERFDVLGGFEVTTQEYEVISMFTTLKHSKEEIEACQ